MLSLPIAWKNYLGYDIPDTLKDFVEDEYKNKKIYPPQPAIFSALEAVKPEEVKVVILGQDPYHGEGQANGLAFSVYQGHKLPPSLRNIYKELESDCHIKSAPHGDLSQWAKQGVLLLNTVLTVEEGHAHSHANKGWEALTDSIIKHLGEDLPPKVFILWGKAAQAKERYINKEIHAVITSAHPSPLAAYRGFFGSRPFSRANIYLEAWGRGEINWNVENEE